MSSEILQISDRTGVNWITTVVLIMFHIGAAAALFLFSWRDFAITAVLYYITIGLGISMGYHRLHTHRSYKVPRGVRVLLRRLRRADARRRSDFLGRHASHTSSEIRSARRSALAARGRVLVAHGLDPVRRSQSQQHPDDVEVRSGPRQARFYRWLNNYHWVPTVVLGLALLAFGGVPLVLWGICLRIVVGLHATWLVNSATHMWGARRFVTRDDSRNNWWVALLTFGEGWHNNHHAHPTSARHGLAWYEFDPSWLQITVLKWLGLAKSIKVAKVTSAVAEQEAA